ncbi:amino acid permease [Halonatronum saccharophilum]|uniref:amino acid permease n=1 Tax=Halonatronum saccharophilum TaxID=150060 RepID=UPI000488A82C|nr:amino acid permease [Halonatronum saccharophilum]
MKQKLDRTLGLYSAITISVGTMIGSAIFVLAGTSFDLAGPSASLAVLLAGLAAVFTAFSFAELVTFIPTAGGGYAYVRDATDNGVLGFITGWGFWLGYAMSCGLFALGFGTFLNYFFPFIPPMIGSYLLIAYVTFTNIKGVENSGKLQNIITTGLMVLLSGYIVYGYFYMDLAKQTPYFPRGISGTFTAMGVLYITYIGYGLITTASEEVIDPEKTIPRAIMISLALVTFVKTAVFLIGSSIVNWEKLIPAYTGTPMIDTAIEIAGSMGGYLFALAGILATVSSINTAMMAASRTSFAMARDKHLPSLFKSISPKTKTPVFSVIGAAFIVIIATTIRDLEHISTITSIFSLTGYSFVNVAVIIFRTKLPTVKRGFKVPFYPITPILGVLVNIFLVFQLMISDLMALFVALIILILGIIYYYVVKPKLKGAPKGITPQPIPSLQFKAKDKRQELEKCYKVLLPIAYPDTIHPLLHLSINIAKSYKGRTIPLHVIDVPEVIPIDSRYGQFKDEMNMYENIIRSIDDFEECSQYIAEPLSVISRNVVHAIKSTMNETEADLLLMGWHKSGFSYKMLGGIVHKVLEEVPKTIGLFKRSKSKEVDGVKNILYPYGGGYHSQATAQIIKRIAEGSGASLTFYRVVGEEVSKGEIEEKREIMCKGLENLELEGDVIIKKAPSIVEGVIEESKGYDLVVLGASSEWGIKGYITGSKTDQIMDKIECNGLVIRGPKTLLQRKRVRDISTRVKGRIEK